MRMPRSSDVATVEAEAGPHPEGSAEICVVYLARAAEGLEPWKAFIDSYAACPGGVNHDLLIAFKGFSSDAALKEYADAAAGTRHSAIRLRDWGYDITSYRRAAKHLQGRYRYLCFLNTNSTFRDPLWLRKMYDWIVKPGVGLVGASGSYESHYANYAERLVRPAARHRSFASRTPRPIKLALLRYWFPEFPNPHVRTNAFMIPWTVMQNVWPRFVLSKLGAYRFESGSRSMTREVMRMGLRVLVVGRDGRGYEPESWMKSDTFRARQQGNLLVADRRTTDYDLADSSTRSYLSQIAWRAIPKR